MPRLAVAREHQIDAIYRESHRVWGAGLALDDYRAMWRELSRTPWAREHATFHVWVEGDDRVLSSMKLYRPRLRLLGRTTRTAVIGAVFTPESARRRGHAAAMVRTAIAQARERGESTALLFSDIGTRYYAGFGFRALPAEEHWGTVQRPAARNGWSLRPATADDLPAMIDAHEAFCLRRPLALMRDAEHWRFLQERSRIFFERLDDVDLESRCEIALRDGRFAGYLITVEGRGEWNVREVGAADGEPRTMAEVLSVASSRAWGHGLRRFYGWLAPGVAGHLAHWRIRKRARYRALPMILPLEAPVDLAPLNSPELAYLPFQDQF